jgi:hypothetical protein
LEWAAKVAVAVAKEAVAVVEEVAEVVPQRVVAAVA